MIDTPFLTTKQVATRLNVDDMTILRWIKAGKIRAYTIGKGYRISQEALDECLASLEVKPESQDEVERDASH